MCEVLKLNIRYSEKFDDKHLCKRYLFIPEISCSYEFVFFSSTEIDVKIIEAETNNIFSGVYQKKNQRLRIAGTFIKGHIYYTDIKTINLKGFEIIEFSFDTIGIPTNSLIRKQWALFNILTGIDINIIPAWKYINRSKIKIGIVDTGIKKNHPNLIGQMNTELEYNFVHEIKETFDLQEDDSMKSSACVGHGTYIAGIIAAKGVFQN